HLYDQSTTLNNRWLGEFYSGKGRWQRLWCRGKATRNSQGLADLQYVGIGYMINQDNSPQRNPVSIGNVKKRLTWQNNVCLVSAAWRSLGLSRDRNWNARQSKLLAGEDKVEV